MAEPIEFRIVQNLQAALQAISVAGGYFYDVAAVAVKLDPNVDVESLIGDQAQRPFLILEVAPDTFSYSPSRMVSIELPATIHFVTDSNPNDDSDFLRTFLRLCADAEQAIATDISRGGLAIDTRITTREYRAFGDSQVWAQIKTSTSVRRFYGSPNG